MEKQRNALNRPAIEAIVLAMALIGCTSHEAANETPIAGVTSLNFPAPCSGYEPDFRTECYSFSVSCENVAARTAEVREVVLEGGTSLLGNVVILTGGTGNAFYGDAHDLQKQTVREIVQSGYRALEIRWTPATAGWAVAGVGYKKSLCAPTKMIQWIRANRPANNSVTCAVGGSGGAAQIAYGLALYDLGQSVKMVLLGSGPPISRVDRGCFGQSTDPLHFTSASPLSRSVTDLVMGWEPSPRYCQNFDPGLPLPNPTLPPPEEIQKAQIDSLVSPAVTEVRNYSYPQTVVDFLLSTADPTNAHNQGMEYHDQITTAKSYTPVQAPVHEIGETQEGKFKIISLIQRDCR